MRPAALRGTFTLSLQSKEQISFVLLGNKVITRALGRMRLLISLFILMADNIRRSLQDINLGVDDEPFVLPADIVRQAEEENSFILIGRPVMPRKQNLSAIVGNMPRNWGFEGLVRGRIIKHRRFPVRLPIRGSHVYGDKERPMGVCRAYAGASAVDTPDGYGNA